MEKDKNDLRKYDHTEEKDEDTDDKIRMQGKKEVMEERDGSS